MDKEIAISVKNVSKTFKIPHEKVSSVRDAVVGAFKEGGYEEFNALDDVSFEVKKGEFFGIIGRNGSGKSTLLKILAGIYQPDKGKVKISGRISPFLELGIGFNPELSGRDNVYLNATVLGLTKKEIDEKFDSIVKFSELERFIDQKLKNYSSGMQVRLAFSVSIHANREILLMDEVLAVGDTNFQAKCIREFTRYKELGRTVIIVTHDISVVQRYCDRAMLLRNGKIVKIGQSLDTANEYIYSNISDEEKRLDVDIEIDELGLKNTDRQKLVSIQRVSLLDENDEERKVFQYGDTIGVKIDFKVSGDIKLLNFGLGFHSDTVGFIFGYNTELDRYVVSESKNSIILRLKNIPILKGEVDINVVVFGENESVPYDYRAKCATMRVFPGTKVAQYNGLVFVEHEWL